MRAHAGVVRLHLVWTGLVRKHAIGYWACIAPGIERAAEVVIKLTTTVLDAETDAILHERCWPMSRPRLQTTAPDGHPAAGARHGP